MKKVIFFSMLALALQIVKAQDFKGVKNAALLNQLELAKTELDKIMADPKAQTKPDGFLWKSKIYAGFLIDEKSKLKYPNALVIADEAFTRYSQLDPTFKMVKDNNATDAPVNIFSSTFKDGVRTFNNKVWDSASYYFKFAVTYSDYLFKNKWLKSDAPFDTTSILYAGYSAQNALKVDDAVKYYTRLMDNKVNDANYIELYKYVLLQYIKKNDKTPFEKYLAASKVAYPKENWEDYEIEFVNKNFSLKDKVTLYDKEDAAGTMSGAKYLQYADVFVNIPKDDKAKMDSLTLDQFQHKALNAFKKAAAKDSADGIAHFNAGIIYYNIYGVYDDRAIENRKVLQDLNANHVVEKDPKKKPAAEGKFKEQTDAIKKLNLNLEKPMMEAVDGCIIYIEKSYNILKDKKDPNNVEKSCLRKSVDFLANMYAIKRDKARGKDPKAYDIYDAKYNFYDKLHK